jgi:predicted alpha/beta-fold hydrolase
MITKPFFFISALDDQMFGPKVIPYGEVHDKILLGVTKYGGHISYLEGGLIPYGQWWIHPSMMFFDHFMKKAIQNEQ